MGKGDRKTAKGKRYNSSYGNARPARRDQGGRHRRRAGREEDRDQDAAAKAPAKKAVAKKTAAKE